MVQLLIVRPDGEVHEIASSEKSFRELLDARECYILNDDDKKILYLWKGSECPVRNKFIGASKSQEVRGQVGMNYKVVPVDEGDEPDPFLAFLDQKPRTGLAKEIKEDKPLGFEVPNASGAKPAVNTTAAEPVMKPEAVKTAKFGQGGAPAGGGEPDGAKQVMASYGVKSSNAQEGPLYNGDSIPQQIQPPSARSQPMIQTAAPQEPSIDFKKIMETLESLEVPEGYEREMTIIGNHAYSVVEKKINFLGSEKIERHMEKIGSLPEGVFFAQGYAPRVLCENQKVLAIEFLKNLHHSSDSQKKLKAKTTDPKELAKQFGMKIE